MATVKVSVLRSFKWPWIWLWLWIVAIIVVIAVCLGPPVQISALPSGTDKVEHFLAYFLLSWGAVQIFAQRKAWAAAALGLVLMGIAIEFAQGALTANRSADAWDVLANACGVLAGMALLLTPLQNVLLWVDRRLFGAH